MLRTLLFFCFAATPLPFLTAFAGYVYFARDLPELRPMSSYYRELQVPTTFHAADGTVIGEFFDERRLIVPLTEMPLPLLQAFLAAEDERFFAHRGVDTRSILRAAVANVMAGKIVQGASTLTQQLGKSMLTNERSFERKIREAILARRMEDVYSKAEILTLYLNKIYLGHNSYGVQAAAQNYFRKDVMDLTLGECAVLAVLPPSPSYVNPVRNLKKTLERRQHVLKMMVKNRFITQRDAKAAAEEPVRAYPLLDEFGERSPLIAQEARKELEERVGDDWIRGKTVYTTVELDLQHGSRQALVEQLSGLDRKQGYRGPVAAVTPDEVDPLLTRAEDWYRSHGMLKDGELARSHVFLAVVTGVSTQSVELAITPELDGQLELKTMRWAGPYREFPLVTYKVERRGKRTVVTKLNAEGAALFKAREMKAANAADDHPEERDQELSGAEMAARKEKQWTIQRRDETARVSWKPRLKDASSAFAEGDVVLVRSGDEGLRLWQQPRVQGAVLTWDPWTGYVRGMVGGSDFDRSQVNRTRSLRQTGSTMKPIYYALAYDMGHRPSYPHSDAPYARGGFASSGRSSDGGTMLTWRALVKSRNAVSLRISEYVTNRLKRDPKRLDDWRTALGLGHPLKGHRAEILGGDQTPWDMSGAFGLFASGGLRAEQTLVRKITDRDGAVLVDRTFFGDSVASGRDTLAAMFRDVGRRKTRAIRESVAYMMRHNLTGVVQAGTATKARKLKLGVAGKTGSLPFDVWFNGFTSHGVTTVWVGSDNRERILGKSKKKGLVYGAGPPLETFMKVMPLAVADRGQRSQLKPVPRVVEMVSVNQKTGDRADGGLSLPHRRGHVPLYKHKGEGSTEDATHSLDDF